MDKPDLWGCNSDCVTSDLRGRVWEAILADKTGRVAAERYPGDVGGLVYEFTNYVWNTLVSDYDYPRRVLDEEA